MIEFDHVSMSYQAGAPLALKDVNFTIEDGEFVFIIGKSGSGKSTIVKLLTCEEQPIEGSVYVGDYCLNRLKRRWVPYLRRNIGMVFQDFRLIETKTIFENIAFALEIQGYSRKAIRRQVSMVLSTVGLRNRENAFPHELSGGEQQRVAIARAMVNNPAVLLADEPTGNLDPANSETIMALLEEINRSGTTVVICTHDQELVNRMKKRVILIDDGHLMWDEQQSRYTGQDETAQPPVHSAAAPARSRPAEAVQPQADAPAEPDPSVGAPLVFDEELNRVSRPEPDPVSSERSAQPAHAQPAPGSDAGAGATLSDAAPSVAAKSAASSRPANDYFK